jgi:stage II sporulation protein D
MARVKLFVLAGFLAGMALAAWMWEAGYAPGSGGPGAGQADAARRGGQAFAAAEGEHAGAAPGEQTVSAGEDVHPVESDRPRVEVGAVQEQADSQKKESASDEPSVRVYLAEERRTETVPLEDYVMGVVAAEMPAGFPQEALEAQALAARTYIVRRLMKGDRGGVPEDAAAEADVTDATIHQRYRPLEQMRRMQKDDPDGWARVRRAVEATRGRVLVYDGEPIQALYFSTSNGYTEASEEVFPFALPYLRSVESPWDKTGAPRSRETTEMPLADFYRKLGVKVATAAIRKGKTPKMRVVEWTQGKRVRTLQIGDRQLAGTEVREKLGLRSTAFSWEMDGDRIAFTTLGSGHGVGMSQWGARFMAEEGYTAEQIVKHYYSGVAVEEVSKLWSPADNYPSL